MDLEVSYNFENQQQVWDGIDEIVSRECPTHDLVDEALRNFLDVAATTREQYVSSEHDVSRYSYILLSSSLFEKNEDYIRRQIVHGLLQDDDTNILLFVTSFLLCDIRETDFTATLLNEEGAFTRLVLLISSPKQDEETMLHRMLMQLLYEMSRIQRIKPDELVCVDDAFICQLFQLIETLSDDVNDPYHYPIIRVLLVLNEQFMVSAQYSTDESRVPLTNKVIKVIASRGSGFKTFGENIILLLNRETETSLQLLTLKLLYLLFTTPSTQEYFYTNDLRVLVDILIRNLLDLPSDAAALRHTYLRVLYPLLAHTQLKMPPHYKCEEIRKLLAVLAGTQPFHGSSVDDELGATLWGHFEEADDTTKRLVSRCKTVIWLKDPETPVADVQAALDHAPPKSPVDAVLGEKVPPAPPVPRKLRKRNASKMAAEYLAPQLDSARESALSVIEITAQREKPGVVTPSRKASLLRSGDKGEKPVPPKTRRSRWRRKSKDIEQCNSEESGLKEAVGKAGADPPHPDEGLDTGESSLVSSGGQDYVLPMKQPPPAPKARRWRGNRRKEEDEGGGTSGELNVAGKSTPLSICTEKTLSGSEPGSAPASVAEALSSAQAEAMDSINEALQRTNLSSASLSEARTVVLAPPSSAPPRGVPGPIFNLERSPFIGDDEDD